MSTGINKKFVEDYYRGMTDNDLLRAVAQDARNLTPEAIDVIEAELKRRNLQAKASSAVAAQNKQYTLEEIDEYANLLQNLPCPRCTKTSNKLNGGQMAEAVSVIIFSTLTTYISIACPQCLDKLTDKPKPKPCYLVGGAYRGAQYAPYVPLTSTGLAAKSIILQLPTNI